MSNFIKDNGGMLAVGAVVLIGLKFYIDVTVGKTLSERGLVEPHEIVTLTDDVNENKDDISDFQTRWNNLIDALAAQRIE